MNSLEDSVPDRTTPLRSTRVMPVVVTTVFAVCVLTFAVLAVQVRDDGVVAFDQPVMLWLHSVSTPWLTTVVQAVTHLGGQIVLVAAVVLAAVLCLLRRWGDALIVMAATIGTSRLNVALKSVFERTRPDFWEHPTLETTSSFPSGHTMAAASMAAVLVVVAWSSRYRWAVLIGAVIYAFVVGVSRVYLGVHFPSDVIAGWCASVLLVTLVVVVVRGVTRWLTPG